MKTKKILTHVVLIIVAIIGIKAIYDDHVVTNVNTTSTTQKTKPVNVKTNTEQVVTSADNDKVIPFKLNGKEYKRTFRKSKQILEYDIYANNHHKAFYSNCDLSFDNNDLQPNIKDCDPFRFRKNPKASGLDWEHVQPASRYGQRLQCWHKAKQLKQSSRNYCGKLNVAYRNYESDLHNLVPAIAEINRDRSNYEFDELGTNNRPYGVDFELDIPNKRVEPADHVKGDVARITLYMNDRYGIALTKLELDIFDRWNELDPVSDWERQKNEIVFKIQGNRNPYVR